MADQENFADAPEPASTPTAQVNKAPGKKRLKFDPSKNPFSKFDPPDDSDVPVLQSKLKTFYQDKLRRIEETLKYNQLVEPFMSDAQFSSKPLVLVIGEHSTGKTSFVEYLLGGQSYEGGTIGPERTTELFYMLDYAETAESCDGKTFLSDSRYKAYYKDLLSVDTGGQKFKEAIVAVKSPATILKKCVIWDTPGLLKGSTVGKLGYEMNKAIGILARLADKIYLVWDATKWRLSDCIVDLVEEYLSTYSYKVTLLMNKAELLRIRSGAAEGNMRKITTYQVLWSLSKVFPGPTPLRLLCFSSKHMPKDCDSAEINRCKEELFWELCYAMRTKTTETGEILERRAQKCGALIFVVKELSSQMGMFSKNQRKKDELLKNLEKILLQVQQKSDQPILQVLDVNELRKMLKPFDMSDIPSVNQAQIGIKLTSVFNDVKKLLPANFSARGGDDDE